MGNTVLTISDGRSNDGTDAASLSTCIMCVDLHIHAGVVDLMDDP
jgi:hypothetical protein